LAEGETEARLSRAEHLEAWLGDLMSELEELMHERGIKYGPGNIAEFGDFGVLVRMADKMARLRNLYVNGAGGDVRDESVEDSLMDVANYAMIMLAWRRGLWPGSEANKPDPTDPLDVRVPSFDRVSNIDLSYCVCKSPNCDLCEVCGSNRCKHNPENMHSFISEEQ
jgi:hypothetical protein